MKIKQTTHVVILVLFLFLVSCTTSRATTTKLTASNAGSTVNIHLGDTLAISLEGNPTTGYAWEVAPDSCNLLEPQVEAEFNADSEALGSGGIVTLLFSAVRQGETSCQLIYHRAFEPDVAPIDIFSFELIVSQ